MTRSSISWPVGMPRPVRPKRIVGLLILTGIVLVAALGTGAGFVPYLWPAAGRLVQTP